MAGTVVFDTLQSGAGLTVPAATIIKGSAKAWVNFNGTGVVAIRDSFNVSSITDGGVGIYTVNMTQAMANTNYAMSVWSNTLPFDAASTTPKTVTAFRFNCFNSAFAATDPTDVSATVFGT